MEYTLAIYTDTGTRKPSNQDSLCIRRVAISNKDQLVLAAVCDGMGGLQKGELASAEVIRAIENWFDHNIEMLAAELDFAQIQNHLTELVYTLNQQIAVFAAKTGSQMGSTVTMILLRGRYWLTMNIGDSRIYQIKNGRATQLTKDQSLVEMEIDRGRITREEAKHHPQRNVLLQCVGMGREVEPVFAEGTIEHDTVYLLCSDGMSHELNDTELAEALNPQGMGNSRVMQDALIDLSERCKVRGETDNITGIAIKAAESSLGEIPRANSFFRRLWTNKAAPQEHENILVLESANMLHTKEYI